MNSNEKSGYYQDRPYEVLFFVKHTVCCYEYLNSRGYQSESKLINGVAGKTTGHVILIWKCWHFRRSWKSWKIVEQRPRLFIP